MTTARSLLAALAAAGLVACAYLPDQLAAGPPAAEAVTVQQVTADVFKRTREALPDTAVVKAELRNTVTGAVLAEREQALAGAQLPQSIDLSADISGLEPGAQLQFRAAVILDGKPAWVSDGRSFTAGQGRVTLGMVEVKPFRPLAFNTVYTCSGVEADIGMADDKSHLRTGGKDYTLVPVVSASGSKYAALADPKTSVWSKGDSAMVTVAGQDLGTCTATSGGEAETVFDCSGTEVLVRHTGETATLRAGGADYPLTQVVAASGAKYAGLLAPEVSFWSKGDGGLLTLDGVAYPDCAITGGYAAEAGRAKAAPMMAPGGAAVAPIARVPVKWVARGHEPGWSLTMDKGELVFVHDYGARTYRTPEPDPVRVEGGMQYTAAPGVLVFTSLAKVCTDAATGMPYPDTVTVRFGEQTFNGCGGETAQVLAGAEWVVESLNGAAVVKGSRITLAFDAANGRVGGKGGCNSYGAAFSTSGEGLSFGPGMSTQMACGRAVMAQERKFLDALPAISEVTIDETGALVLSGAAGTRIVARR
ncbi:MAG: META domain-containing protein [Hyphomonas sp.]|jgi:heat shock protein HslJ/membrane-bound inhibitor of C-type lysozyme/uncharacterized lipoprotein YbaY